MRSKSSKKTHIIRTLAHAVSTSAVDVIPSFLAPLGNQLGELERESPLRDALVEIGNIVEIDFTAVDVEECCYILSVLLAKGEDVGKKRTSIHRLDGIAFQSAIVVEVDAATSVWQLISDEVFEIGAGYEDRGVAAGGDGAGVDSVGVSEMGEKGKDEGLDETGELHCSVVAQ